MCIVKTKCIRCLSIESTYNYYNGRLTIKNNTIKKELSEDKHVLDVYKIEAKKFQNQFVKKLCFVNSPIFRQFFPSILRK